MFSPRTHQKVFFLKWRKWGCLMDNFFFFFFLVLSWEAIAGENRKILCFGKICDKLELFRKYLATYHFFSTRVSQNLVQNRTRVQSTRVPSESLA